MPNINLANLAGIPGPPDQAAMTQNGPNNCGAYAIVAAVGAHAGVFPLANEVHLNNAVVITLDDDYQALSAAVYQITGILNPAPGPGGGPPNPELVPHNGYNSPAAMAQVAIDLGRPAPQINVQQAGFQNLNNQYPGEQGRCAGVVGAGNVNVVAGQYGAPALEFTHVVCVATHAGGLHWLAQGSDGNFYDPANGTLNNVWNPGDVGDAMGNDYIFTGLWMVID